MKIIVIGCGKVGRSAAMALSNEGHDVTVVDNKPERIFNLANEMDVLAVPGSGLSHETLMEAGIRDADLLIALTGIDELNLLCALMAKKLGVSQTIARVRNPEYESYMQELSMDLGISLIINPELEAAREIFRSLSLPSGVSSEVLATKNSEIFKLKIQPDSPLCHMPVRDIPQRLKANILVCIVERNDQAVIPDGDFVLEAKDQISIVGSMQDIRRFFEKIHVHSSRVRDVMVVGAGKVAFYLANLIRQTSISLTMIEKDELTCSKMAEAFPFATIIYGNGSDEDLLLEEGLEDTDVFVALTGIDEENIILSLYAGSNGIKTITKINRIAFDKVVAAMDLDTVINPKKLTLETILRYVRAAVPGLDSNVESVHKLAHEKAEGLEFHIQKESAGITGIPLHALKLKEGVLISKITRASHSIVPRGSDMLLPGDHVMVVTSHPGLYDLRQIVEGAA